MKKALPNTDPQYSSLFTLPYAAVKWELLKTAIKLSVFDSLSEPLTSGEVAALLSSHPENTEHLLNALTAIGCLSKKDGRFCNTLLAESFLVQGKDTSIGDSLLFMDQWNHPVLNGGMMRLVKNGPPATNEQSIKSIADKDIWKKAARLSVNHARAGRARMLASYVSALPEFSSFAKMLDLGAGPGILGIAVTALHPSLKCYLFDQPAVTEVADEVIAEYRMEDRVESLQGDYVNDPIGDGYDFVMANYTLNFYKDRLGEIMAKVHRSLNPGGVFMVTSDGLTDDKTAPQASVISWLATALQGRDMSFEQDVLPEAMLATGFVSVRSRTLNDIEVEAHGPVDMHVARKSK